MRHVLAALCLLGLLAGAAVPAPAAPFDPVHTRLGFHLRTRWGTRVVGVFPRYEGEVVRLDDGRRQVRIDLDVDAVEIPASARYTANARGPRFFDAAAYPRITFESEPFSPALLERGGPLRGWLTLRGVRREETFELLPSACGRPGRDCDVVARGTVRRDHYGMDGLQFALQNRVHFTLRVRIADDGT